MTERLYPIESTVHFELDEDQAAAYRDEPTLASTPVPVMAEDRDYHNQNCRNALLMPYALVRYGLAQLAARRKATR